MARPRMIVAAGRPGSGMTRYFLVTAFGVDSFNIHDHPLRLDLRGRERGCNLVRVRSFDGVITWLLTTGRHLETLPTLLAALCERLDERGFELLRALAAVDTLHPQVAAEVVIWRPASTELELRAGAEGYIVGSEPDSVEYGVVERFLMGFGSRDAAAYRASPLHQIVVEGAPRVRCRIRAEGSLEYPVLEDLRKAGATDYVALALRFLHGARSGTSWVTNRPGGFSDEQLELLEKLCDPLATVIDAQTARRVTRALLRTYVGTEAGERVLAGKIRRGDVERIHAAIWFSDLRDFTRISGSVDSETLIAWLNGYFGVIHGAIAEKRGEILKFIGDAVLAVFAVDEKRGASAACRDAIEAARLANEALDALNDERTRAGLPVLEHGVALHVGEAQYGNVGAEQRLDFTVIGPAVNLASRLESLCKKLGRRVVLSEEVATCVGGESVELGTFELKGIDTPVRVFAPSWPAD